MNYLLLSEKEIETRFFEAMHVVDNAIDSINNGIFDTGMDNQEVRSHIKTMENAYADAQACFYEIRRRTSTYDHAVHMIAMQDVFNRLTNQVDVVSVLSSGMQRYQTEPEEEPATQR